MSILKTILGVLFITMFTISCSNESTEAGETTATETTNTEAPAEKKEEEVKGYKVGDIAEDFKLKNIDGNMLSMADFPDAKGFVIVFTCNHCPYSIAYEDRLIAIDQKYKELGYPVIAINPNDPELVPEDSYENMIARAEEKDFSFPYLMDEGQQVYPKFGATKTPHVYLINKTEAGNEVAYIGAIDDNKNAADAKVTYLENALKTIIGGGTPEVTFTKAVGCSVKCTKKEDKI